MTQFRYAKTETAFISVMNQSTASSIRDGSETHQSDHNVVFLLSSQSFTTSRVTGFPLISISDGLEGPAVNCDVLVEDGFIEFPTVDSFHSCQHMLTIEA